MLNRKRFMVGKYLLRYTVFVDGNRPKNNSVQRP